MELWERPSPALKAIREATWAVAIIGALALGTWLAVSAARWLWNNPLF